LFDAVSAGMRHWPEVRLSELSRMADTDRWGEAVARGLGWAPGTFVNAYKANRRSTCQNALEESPVYIAILKLLLDQRHFDGSPTELFSLLTNFTRSRPTLAHGMPKTSIAFSRILSKMVPQLREVGIAVDFGRGHQARKISIRWIRTAG
jgi:hypothetical protein